MATSKKLIERPVRAAKSATPAKKERRVEEKTLPMGRVPRGSKKAADSSRATIRDVAKAAGVSVFTVSAALNGKSGVSEKTRAVVEVVARELSYQPNPHAQRLVAGRAFNTIGLFSLSLDFGVGTRKMRGIQRSLLERDFSAVIHGFGNYAANKPLDQSKLLADLRHQAPRAIICETDGLKPEAHEELRRYVEEGGILICHCPYRDIAVECDKVTLDYGPGTRAAARHLVEMGHREIGFLMISPQRPKGPIIGGFREGLREQGLDVREEFILWGGEAGETEEAGEALARQFLALPQRPTAVYIVNDYVAQVFIAEIGRAGVLVPRDLSVIGNDDAPIARCGALPLTTVSHPVAAITASILRLLYSRLDGHYDGAPRHEVIESELIVRQSVTPPQNLDTSTPRGGGPR